MATHRLINSMIVGKDLESPCVRIGDDRTSPDLPGNRVCVAGTRTTRSDEKF